MIPRSKIGFPPIGVPEINTASVLICRGLECLGTDNQHASLRVLLGAQVTDYERNQLFGRVTKPTKTIIQAINSEVSVLASTHFSDTCTTALQHVCNALASQQLSPDREKIFNFS